MPDAARAEGYSRLSIATHWLAAIAVVVLFVTHEGSRGSAAYVVHVSGGAIVGVFLLWRVFHRLAHGFARRPDQALILNIVSKAVIWGFLAAIVVTVITGYLLPWSLGRPLEIFGLIDIASPIDRDAGLHRVVEEAHEVAGQLFPLLLALHLLGTAKHAILDRDGVARRIFVPAPDGR